MERYKKMDAAFFWLIATSYYAVAQTSDSPSLVIKPSGPVLSKSVGEDLLLSCGVQPEIARDAVSNIRWRDQNNDLIGPSSLNPRLRVDKAANNMPGKRLIITSAQREDEGSYTCEADFPGHDPLKATINIKLTQPARFDRAPSPQHPLLDTDALIECVVSGNPAPQVDWLLDGSPIESGGRYTIEHDGLRIRAISIDDNGVYTCRAVVDETGQLAKTDITVEVHSPPRFEDGGEPQNARGLEGREASMQCVVSGIPRPEITWIFANGGHDVTKMEDENGAVRHTVDNILGTMTVRDVKKRDEGEYKCLAKNVAGTLEHTARLHVVEKPRFDIVENATVNEGDVARIQCVVTGDPDDIFYVKEDQMDPIRNGDRHSVEREGNRLTLTIRKVERSDDGLYFCTASNEAATENKASHITVQYKPSLEHTPMNSAKTWIGNPEPVNLTCIAQSIPNATIRWEKTLIQGPSGLKTMPLDENSENIIIDGHGPTSNLVITPRVPDDFVDYICIAHNLLGEARHSIRLFQAHFPGPVSRVEFPVVTANSIRFNLDGPVEPDNLALEGYEVYFIEAGGSFAHANKRFWPIGVPYVLSSLKPSHKYIFRFYAKNYVGISQETRDFEITLPDIGPPRPPEPVSSNETDSSKMDTTVGYKLQWHEPEDNGARILDYHISYWKDGEREANKKTIVAKAPSSSYYLKGLDRSSRYHIQIGARNERGMGPTLNMTIQTGHTPTALGVSPPRVDPAEAGVLWSIGLVAGIAAAAIFILLLLIDVILFVTKRIGITAFICRRCCGHSSKPKHDKELGPTDSEDIGRCRSGTNLLGTSFVIQPAMDNVYESPLEHMRALAGQNLPDMGQPVHQQLGRTRSSAVDSDGLEMCETDV